MLKRFAALTKKIKDIMELLGKKDLTKEDDAMFTKKYVGPVDCASCDKGIINLNGMRAEHLNWNRLPFREPNERIAKVSAHIFL